MSTMTQLLRRLSLQFVALPSMTASARATGEITADEEVVVRIRRVLGKEIAVTVGTVPQLFGLARERLEGETVEQLRDRLTLKLLEDPDLIGRVRQEELSMTLAVVALAVTGFGTRNAAGETDVEDVRMSADSEGEFPAASLGADLQTVYDAVLAFSTSRLGGAAGTEAFPAQPPGGAGEQGGGHLRADADEVPL